MNIVDKVKENNPIAFTIIKNAIDNDKVAHAYLFSAPKNTIIEDEPVLLAQSLVSENPFTSEDIEDVMGYPDLTIIDGSQGVIKKEQVLNAAETLQQTTLDSRGIKILIIKNVENGNKQSLNSLLKFIEEPTKKTFIIMTTNNVSQVISTIRSRAQVVNLRSIPFEKLVTDIESKKVDPMYSRILASITKSSIEAKEVYGVVFRNLYTKLVEAMKEARLSPDKALTELSPLIMKSNMKVVVPMLRTYINDIWKINQGMPIAFVEEQIQIESYASSNFDFQEALVVINDFLVSQDYHVNFELYKSQLLIKLRRCYG